MASIIDPTDDSIITGGLQGCNACDEALQAARREAAERGHAVVLQDDDGNWQVPADGDCTTTTWTDGGGWALTADTKLTINLDDYNNWQQGTEPVLYLDPEATPPTVESFASIGNNGLPVAAHDHRLMSLGSYNQSIVAESLAEWLRAREDEILAIAEGYEGSEWNGSNHVGSWTAAACEASQLLSDELAQDISSDMIVSYWDADDYLNGITASEVVDEVLRLGGIVEAAEYEINNGETNGHRLDQDDMETAIRHRLESERDDFDGEDEDADHERHAQIEALLA